MKYIMLRVKMKPSFLGGRVPEPQYDVPVIFPNSLVHKLVADAMAAMLRQDDNVESVEPHSAGDIRLHVFSTTGRSATLGLAAKPEDRGTIDLHDFHSGLVTDEDL